MTHDGRRPLLRCLALWGLLAGCQAAPRDAASRADRLPPRPSPSPAARFQRLPPVDRESTSVALASHHESESPLASAASPFREASLWRESRLLRPFQEPETLPAPNPPNATRPNATLPDVTPPNDTQPNDTQPNSLAAAPALPLDLQDVVRSVQQSHPLLAAAMMERGIANGKQLSAWGEFDLNVKAFGIAAPEGFYQTYRNGVSLNQPLFQGGYAYGGYKIGDGSFQPWFKERETDEGGEFSAGFGVPLLKDRRIDKRRAAVFQADLARRAVEPAIQFQLLEFVRIASQAYWSWVAAGQSLHAQRELLNNAEARVRQIQEKVEAGDLPRIARINNEQLIADRESKVIEAERKIQQAAIKLSLFLRDDDGVPIVPDSSRLPDLFPETTAPASDQIQADLARAIAASPLLREIDLIAAQTRVALRNAENMMLPKLDARLLASKDVGAPASAKRDKTPFELEAEFYGEVPLQRREARGKIAEAQGKLSQLNAKRRFIVDKVTAAVRDAVSALQAAAGRVQLAEKNLRLARETLTLGKIQFDAGDSDLVTLNIYEKSLTDAQLLLISAQADFFVALADYRAALSQTPGSGD